MYISRANIPYEFRSKVTHFKSIYLLSRLNQSLFEIWKIKRSDIEKSEDLELIRALDLGMKIKTLNLIGDSFSVDVFEDFTKAQSQIKKDRYLKFYR